MAGFDGGADFFLVDLYAQTRPGEKRCEAFLVVEHARIDDVIEEVAALIVVNAKALLLNKRIGRTKVHLEGGGEAERAEAEGVAAVPRVLVPARDCRALLLTCPLGICGAVSVMPTPLPVLAISVLVAPLRLASPVRDVTGAATEFPAAPTVPTVIPGEPDVVAGEYDVAKG